MGRAPTTNRATKYGPPPVRRQRRKRAPTRRMTAPAVCGGDDAAEGQQTQQNCQRNRAPVLTPAKLIPLEEGELRFPIYTIIVGQIGSHLISNKHTLTALGIPRAQHDELLLALSINAVRRTHHCLATYKHLCRTVRTARPPDAPPPPPSGIG